MRARGLRDRKPGRVSWHDSPSATTTYNTRVYIQADGHAIVEESGGVDLCNYTGPDGRRKLEDPADFADCLALATSGERFTCMTDGFGEQVIESRPLNESCANSEPRTVVTAGRALAPRTRLSIATCRFNQTVAQAAPVQPLHRRPARPASAAPAARAPPAPAAGATVTPFWALLIKGVLGPLSPRRRLGYPSP